MKKTGRIKAKEGGAVLFSDGSAWEVSIMDRGKLMMWLPLDEIEADDGDGTLTNTSRNEKVEAKKLR